MPMPQADDRLETATMVLCLARLLETNVCVCVCSTGLTNGTI